MEKNRDFVAFIPSLDCIWEFYITGKAEKLSETCDEIIEVVETLFAILQGFYIPTKIEYNLLTFPKDVPAGETFNSKPSGGTTRIIQSIEGISFQKLKEDVQSIVLPRDGIKNIRGIEIKSGKTKVSLNGKDSYIDRNSKEHYKWCLHDEIIEEQPIRDLFEIDIRHCKPENGVDTIYAISFWTYTDIWFEDTEIGLKNRNQLGLIFKRLYESFNVIGLFFDSNKFDDNKMKNIVFGRYSNSWKK